MLPVFFSECEEMTHSSIQSRKQTHETTVMQHMHNKLIKGIAMNHSAAQLMLL
jgi:hypothetical protein